MRMNFHDFIKNKILEIEQTSSFRALPGKLSIWIKTKTNVKIYEELMNDEKNFGNDFLQRLYNIRYDVKDWPKCKICGNAVNEFLGYNKGYKETCCKKCTNLLKYGVEHPMKSKDVQTNLKNAIFKKYGVENAYQAEEVKQKIKQTNLKKYGAENPQQNSIIHQKTIETNYKKYGTASPLSNENVRSKLKQTNLERYGAESPLSSKEVWKKIKKTNIEKYGSEFSISNADIQEKIKTVNIEKYGVENPLQSNEIRKKIQKTCFEKYNAKTPFESKEILEKTKITTFEKYNSEVYSKSREFLNKSFNDFKERIKDYIIPLFNEDEYEGMTSDKILKWKCVKCGNIFEQSLNGSHAPININYVPRCWKCFPHLTNISKDENELYEFCKKYFNDTIKNDKKLIKNDLDIVIPSIKIALEFNGVYYHSTQFKKQGLHLEKVLKCNEHGYRLIHIWEDEWINDKELIKNKLLYAFNNLEENLLTDEIVVLDRSWFNNITFKNYELIKVLPPKIINRMGFNVENCGQLIFKKEI